MCSIGFYLVFNHEAVQASRRENINQVDCFIIASSQHNTHDGFPLTSCIAGSGDRIYSGICRFCSSSYREGRTSAL